MTTSSDAPAVDLTELREMTGGDPELEKALFSEYIRAGEGFVELLKQSTDDAHREQWRKTAHAFKGIALNLGAATLGATCARAQTEHETNEDNKRALLAQITSEFRSTTAFLEQL